MSKPTNVFYDEDLASTAVVEDSALSVQQNTSTTLKADKEALYTAAFTEDGGGISDEYKKVKSKNISKTALELGTENIQEERATGLAEILGNTRGYSSDVIDSLLPLASDFVIPGYTKPLEMLITENSTTPSNQKENQDEYSYDIQVDALIGDTIQDWFAPYELSVKSAVGEILPDLLDLLFIPDEGFRNFQISNELAALGWGEERGLEDIALGQGLLDLGKEYSKLPYQDQFDFLKLAIRAIERSTTNPLERESLLAYILNPSQLRNAVERGADFLDVLGIGQAVKAVLKSAGSSSDVSKIKKAAASLVAEGKNSNPVKAMNETGSPILPAKLNEAAVENPEIASALNISETVARNNQSPFAGIRSSTLGSTDLSAETAIQAESRLDAMRIADVKRELAKFSLNPKTLTPDEFEDLVKTGAFNSEIQDIAATLQRERNFDILDWKVLDEPIDSDADRIIRFRTKNRSGAGDPQYIDVEYYFKYDDVNSLKLREGLGPKNQGLLSAMGERFLSSPQVSFDRFVEGWAASTSLSDNQTVRIIEKMFKPLYKEAFGGLNKKELAWFNSLLAEQRRTNKAFSVSDLKAGVETQLGRLSVGTNEVPNLLERYEAVQETMRKSWAMHNNALYRQNVRMGKKSFTVFEQTEDGLQVPVRLDGKVLEPGSVPNSTRLWVPSLNKAVAKESKEAQELLKTHSIVEPSNKLRTLDGKDRYRYGLVPKEDLKSPSLMPAGKIEGYLPNISKAQAFYIRVIDSAADEGVPLKRLLSSNEGLAASKRQSDLWMTHAKGSSRDVLTSHTKTDDFKLALRAQLEKLQLPPDEIQKAIDEGEGKYWFLDTEKTAADTTGAAMQNVNKNKRATHEILDLTGEGDMPPATAIGHMLARVARDQASEDNVLFNQQRWLKSANTAGDNGTSVLKDPGANFWSAEIDETKLGKANPKYWNLIKQQRDLKQLQNLPVFGQELVHSAALRAAEILTNNPKIAKAMGFVSRSSTEDIIGAMTRYGQRDPQAFASSLTFHTYLGMGNVKQYPLQLSQGLVAFGTNPDIAPAAFRKSMFLNLLDTRLKGGSSLVEKVSSDKLVKAAKLSGLNTEKEIRSFLDVWQKLGQKEGVVMNADWANMIDGASMTPHGIRKMADLFIKPYSWGEIGQQQIAFTIAGERMLKNNKNLTWTKIAQSKDLMRELNNRMGQFTFQMKRSNKAPWQHNFSLGSQFKQHMGKTLEALGLLPGTGGFWKQGAQWSPGQRLALVSSQAVIFGASGVAFADVLVDSFRAAEEQLTGSRSSIDAVDLGGDWGFVIVDDGLLGLLQEYFLGTRYDLGGAFGVTGMVQDFAEGVADMGGTLPEVMLGPAMGVFGDRWVKHGVPATLGLIEMAWNPDMSELRKKAVLTDYLEILTSTKNLWTATEAHQSGFWADPTGKMLLELDPDAQTFFGVNAEVIGAALGLPPERKNDEYKRKRLERAAQENMNKLIQSTTATILKNSERDLTKLSKQDYEDIAMLITKVGEDAFPNNEQARGEFNIKMNRSLNTSYTKRNPYKEIPGRAVRGSYILEDQ